MDATEEKILETAKKPFLRHGYAGTTTGAVSARAGMNKSLIHYYFRTKKDLY
ncbi:MAG: TetR/AcrR family transcriptional regulator, partial [Bacteroidota bacterium]